MLLTSALSSELAAASADESQVMTSVGHYHGVIDATGVRSFRGIRYAESPAGGASMAAATSSKETLGHDFRDGLWSGLSSA
jgi:hypothetical protein